MDVRFRVRKSVPDHQAMRTKAKPSRSPALAALNKYHDGRDAEVAKVFDKWLANIGKNYPHDCRGEVFCWLWDNYDGVRHAIERHWRGWHTIAALAEQDGVKGRWGEPPTANAIRRVMTRVVREKGDEMPKTGH